MSESTPTSNEDALKVVLVDQSRDAQDEARDLADARLERELGEGGKFKRFVNGVWKGNLARDYYRQKYIHQSLDTIHEENDVYATESTENRARALESTIDRFQRGYEESIHREAGESRERLKENDDLATGVKQLIREFAEGRLNAEGLQEERTRFLNEYREAHGADAIGEGIVTVDNILDIARSVAGAVEHGESLDATMARLQVITGEARDGVRTEAKYNAVDKAVEKLSRTKIGSLVSPVMLATATAAAMSVARAGSHSVVGAATKTLIPGAAAALWAGLRENKRVKDERVHHSREMAQGGTSIREGDSRREEMETTRYETISAQDLTGHLRMATEADRLDGKLRSQEHPSGNDPMEAIQAAVDALAAIQARVELSDSSKADLISFTEKAAVGEERMMLDLARREALMALEARLTDDVRRELSLDEGGTVRDAVRERSTTMAEVLTGNMTERDEAFAKLKRRRVKNAVAIGAITGVLGGMVVQEGIAAVDPTRFGLIDVLHGGDATPYSDGEVHQTLLAGAFRGGETTIHVDAVHVDASSTYDNYAPSGNTEISLSSDHTLETNPDGTMSLLDGNGSATVEGLTLDDDGNLTQESLDKLSHAGMTVEDTSFNEEVVTSETVTQSASEYIHDNIDETTHVTRDFWYGNDTSGVYDHNELGIHYGGSAEHPGIVDGGYQYTVAGMTAEGSWQGGESVDWNQAAENGNLFVAVSGTGDTQSQTFMIPIGPDGKINISADSPAGQFFSEEGGKASFNGAYMEVVQTAGVDQDGTVHIRPLATVVGDRSVGNIETTVSTTTVEHHAEYAITTDGYDAVPEHDETQTNFTEMAPITPVYLRKNMEAVRRGGENGPEGYGYGEGADAEKLRRWESERSPRLRDNPDAELNPHQELDFYYEQQRKKRGEAYVQEIEKWIDESPALKGMSGETRAVVAIPVGAVQEADNIYKTLSLYAQQDPESQEKTTILLNVNWIDDAMQDPAKRAQIEKTKSEIERARQDFPQLNIASFEKEWSREWVRDTRNNAMYGEVVKVLYDTASFAVRRAINEGRLASDRDVLLITNDADALGMNRHYFKHYIEAREANPESDIFLGNIRWGTDAAETAPGYHAVAQFMDFANKMAASSVRDTNLNVATWGPNSGVSLTTLAAVGGPEDHDRMGAGADSEMGRRILAGRGRYIRDGQDAYGNQGARYLVGSSKRAGTRKKVARVVGGADIDSSPDRILGTYLEGTAVHRSWEAFNAGKTRAETIGAVEGGAESSRTDMDGIRSRVEFQISELISNWYRDEGSVSFLLSMMFPGSTKGKGDAWTLRKQGNHYTFAFTDYGASQFKNQLERQVGTGRFDPLVNRLRRRLYGEVKPGAKRQPVQKQAPLVRPTA